MASRMTEIIGTCSLCGGPVWRSVEPTPDSPPARCESCGAEVANNYGPVLPMMAPPFKLIVKDRNG